MQEIQRAIGMQQAHACEHIGDGTQAGCAGEIVAPYGWFVAVHIGEIGQGVRAAQSRLDLACAIASLRGRPARQPADIGQVDQQGSRLQPGHQVRAIRRIENGQRAVFGLQRGEAVMSGNEMQIVIAENRVRRLTKAMNQTQGAQRVRPACDQIAGKIETILRGVEGDGVEQVFQRGATALHIADGIVRHAICPLVEHARNRQREGRDGRFEALADFVDHAIAAVHAAHRCLEHGAAGVFEVLARC